jgi:hypothetical protein
MRWMSIVTLLALFFAGTAEFGRACLQAAGVL